METVIEKIEPLTKDVLHKAQATFSSVHVILGNPHTNQTFQKLIFCFTLVLLIEYLYYQILYPAFFSPLRKLPHAHWTARFSSIWIHWIRWTARENETLGAAHQRLGPLIRLGPKEVSVNSFEGGLRSVYSGGFEKHRWYSPYFENHGLPNMFSTIGSRPHSDRKRLQSNIYSKSYLQSSEDIRAISTAVVIDRLIPILDKLAETGQEFDIMETLYSATMDLVTAFQFGLSSSTDFLCDVAERRRWLELYQKRHIHRFAFFSQEFPTLTSFLAKLQIRLVPRWVDDANAQLEAWCLSHVDRCLATHSSGAQPPGFNPVVVNALYEGLIRQDPSLTPSQARLLVASELLDQVAAGHETSSLTMTQLILHLSAFPNLQGLLHREFSSLPHDPPPSPRELDAFPLLQVVLRETLRLTPPIPGPQPRITPPSGCFLTPPSGKQYFIPRDVRISASAYALHRNPDVFPMPTAWRPDRWLDNFISTPASSPGRSMNGPDKSTATSETETKDRYFWAFGSGGRMCLGSNLAMLQMKLLIAALYARYKTVVVEGQDTSVADGYMGYIGNGKLMIRLEKWEASGRSRPDSAISMGSGESGV